MPAYGNFMLDKGYDAEAALTKYRAVKVGSGVEGVTPITVAGETGVGVSQFDVTTGEIARGKGASVREQGITEWEAGGAIGKGVPVTVDSVGRCVTAVDGNYIWGESRQSASGSGKRIAVTLSPVKIMSNLSLS